MEEILNTITHGTADLQELLTEYINGNDAIKDILNG